MNAVLGLLKALEVNQMAATVKGRLLVLVLGLEAIKSNVMGRLSTLKVSVGLSMLKAISMALKCLKSIFKWAIKYWALKLDNGFLSVGHTTQQGHLELQLKMRWPISMDSVQIN
ncbi:hypothetical protein WN943_027893 [Citrus x changshan-huyou]